MNQSCDEVMFDSIYSVFDYRPRNAECEGLDFDAKTCNTMVISFEQ